MQYDCAVDSYWGKNYERREKQNGKVRIGHWLRSPVAASSCIKSVWSQDVVCQMVKSVQEVVYKKGHDLQFFDINFVSGKQLQQISSSNASIIAKRQILFLVLFHEV
jgi:hypothetical protein